MMPSSGARRCIFGFPPPLHRTNVECILVLDRLVVARDCAEKQLPYMIVWVFIAVYSREYLPAFPSRPHHTHWRRARAGIDRVSAHNSTGRPHRFLARAHPYHTVPA